MAWDLGMVLNRHIGTVLCAMGLLQSAAFADGKNDYVPLYAGTMLAFFAENVEPGSLAIQPYLFVTRQPGFYDGNWKAIEESPIQDVSTLLLLETGITPNVDITLIMTESYTHVDHRHTFLYDDMQAYLGFQILRDQKGTYQPDLRLLVGENFPTGKFDHLDPLKLQSDASGSGSFETSFILVARKILYWFPKHPFNWNLNLFYLLPCGVNVSGYNVYGGASGIKGRVSPGDTYLVNLAFEFSFTRNWVIGMDMRYVHQNKSTFKDIRAKVPHGSEVSFGLPSSEEFSLAPCLEYSFTENFGVEAGTWFTVKGRNANNFISAIATVYYEF